MNANMIRAKIAERGMTQAQVAEAMGISPMSLSRKLTGKREFTLGEVDDMCYVLNITDPVAIFFTSASQIRNDNKTVTT